MATICIKPVEIVLLRLLPLDGATVYGIFFRNSALLFDIYQLSTLSRQKKSTTFYLSLIFFFFLPRATRALPACLKF